MSAVYRTVVRAWRHQVRRSPHRTALVAGREWLSFAEVDGRAERLARWLVDEGAGPELVVANRLPYSVEAVIAQLAVLKAGAVHVAVPPTEPAERASAILRDADPVIILDVTSVPKVDSSPTVLPQPEDAIYLTYPVRRDDTLRGVVVEHRNLANLLEEHYRSLFRWAVAACGMGPLRVAHSGTWSTDSSWELLLWMVAGHEAHLIPEDVRAGPSWLAAFIAEAGLDVLAVPGAMAEPLAATGILRTSCAPGLLLIDGDAIGQPLWNQLRAAPATTAVNLYGPSECTVFCARAVIDRHATPVIGTPVANAKATVIDASGEAVPDGDSGELVISGAAVARGYHDPADPRMSRFTVPDAVCPNRRYRTGDAVRRLPDGELEFLGRRDGRDPDRRLSAGLSAPQS
ncbi:AMP-binding protein [Stackebrandtia nassauensis]|uniref:AMP-dependent synthetase and ligase n=1 Tax=Stackebrandtia nassauensis (strain DSM 44728 / CIP 108903 / NRRL B-16338 / NBRC 102104 / LLR-40K-21) TaxID=446470 RepID=D3Q2L0_STANL|nr:AMP-binding protein [Stackebrandtia nassauensis]ADD45761.1 AMP-dependent synthetase and ligase [Stackebrandtia nassauensis DSM 44728]